MMEEVSVVTSGVHVSFALYYVV